MKVLLFCKEENIKPVGGPKGYLYNLKFGLDEINNKDFEFIKSNSENNCKNFKFLMNRVLKKVNFKSQFTNICKKNYNNYDMIHFHSTFDLYYERKNLMNYKGKILLTSHSPKPWHMEYIDDRYGNKKISKRKKNFLESIDIYSFNRANFIIFPCEEAEEPYYNQWNFYRYLKENNQKKYKYLISGTRQCTSLLNSDEINKKYNIPRKAFIISYVGRHNDVKGYDSLLKYGEKILEQYENVYFLIAGKEGPIYGLNNPRWIEVGWTNDPHSIISASNLFLLPNKETYFDLIFLEVLSLGIPILASFTGGNKYFAKFKNSEIYLYNNDDNFFTIINKLINNKKVIKNTNKRIFNDNFNEKIFANNYVELINSLGEVNE